MEKLISVPHIWCLILTVRTMQIASCSGPAGGNTSSHLGTVGIQLGERLPLVPENDSWLNQGHALFPELQKEDVTKLFQEPGWRKKEMRRAACHEQRWYSLFLLSTLSIGCHPCPWELLELTPTWEQGESPSPTSGGWFSTLKWWGKVFQPARKRIKRHTLLWSNTYNDRIFIRLCCKQVSIAAAACLFSTIRKYSAFRISLKKARPQRLMFLGHRSFTQTCVLATRTISPFPTENWLHLPLIMETSNTKINLGCLHSTKLSWVKMRGHLPQIKLIPLA